MANEFIRKEFAGGVPPAQLTALMSPASTSVSIDDATGWLTGTSFPFVIVIDSGAATEEKLLVANRVGLVLDVVERGYDGTVAQSHVIGSRVAHCLDAYTVDQVNRLANLQVAVGQLIGYNGTNPVAIPAPTGDGQILTASAAAPAGALWVPYVPVTPTPGQITAADRAARLALTGLAAQTVVYEASTHLRFVWTGSDWRGLDTQLFGPGVVLPGPTTTPGDGSLITVCTLVVPDTGCPGQFHITTNTYLTATIMYDVINTSVSVNGSTQAIDAWQVASGAGIHTAHNSALYGITGGATTTILVRINRLSGTGTAQALGTTNINNIEALFVPTP